jgi:hypothetical protein
MMHHVTIEQARAARNAARQTFEPLASITGIGIIRVGDDYGIKVNVREPIRRGSEIPTRVDGVPVSVHVTGEIRPL